MLGLKSVADLDGYPHLKESNRLQKAMTLSEYSKGARENLKKNKEFLLFTVVRNSEI